jgi:hypothetical protein
MMAGKNWLGNIPRGGRRSGVKVVTNNPERGSNSFRGLKAVGFGARTIRRLVKTDPNNAQNQKDGLLQTPGMSGNGGTRGVSIKGKTESRRVTVGSANSGAPRKLVDRSKASNIRGLKKR